MKYIARELTENVNVSKSHPLAELAWLAGGLLAVVAILYLSLWWVADRIVPRVPVQVEVWAGQQLMARFPNRPDPQLTERVRNLVRLLPAASPLHRYDFSVSVMEQETVNALALPGGRIVIFSGLLKQIESENELTMILGHELGHYAHRDHLRGMGRGLGMTLALAMLFGQHSQVAGMASNLLIGMEMRYSQQQEKSADAYGLDLLVQTYGHAGGATDFFLRLADQDEGKLAYLLASHPHPQDRIAGLRKMIARQGYAVGPTVPLPETLVHQSRECP
jgi:predicted Zn-dependent protease